MGLRSGEPGCTANVVIVATTDAPAVARTLVEENRNAFSPGGSGMTLSKAALEDFKTGDRAVRWWHVSVPTDSETGERAVRLPGEDARQTNVSRASRLSSDIRDDLNKVIIIIDVDRIGDTTFTQLADYVAMVAMAQIDASASTEGLPTVLNLFNNPQGTPGLSDWDLAYLTALYKAEQSRSTRQGQAGELTTLMLQARAAGDVDNVPVEPLGEIEAAGGRTLVLLTRRYRAVPAIRGRTYVQPSRPIPVGQFDITNPAGVRAAYELGHEDGERFARTGATQA